MTWTRLWIVVAVPLYVVTGAIIGACAWVMDLRNGEPNSF